MFYVSSFMFHASKKLGQHFLQSPKYLRLIVDASQIEENDTVLEIGPGTGNLTELLLKKAKLVIGVEKDKRMITYLEKRFSGHKSLKLIHEDILKLHSNFQLPTSNYSIVGNIPYYLTSHLFRIIFEKWPRPEKIVFTIQKEVAQRITAKPPQMNLLAVSVQYFGRPEIVSLVPAGAFAPSPKVDSAIITINPVDLGGTLKDEVFFKVIKAGFGQPRKLLLSNLQKKLGVDRKNLSDAFHEFQLSGNSRAQELSVQQWQKIALWISGFLQS